MAFGSATFSNLGGAVSDIFSTQATAASMRLKARGDLAEAESYDLAADLARQQKQFTEQSTAIKVTQADRDLTRAMGETRADVAGAGFAERGSALDILRDSASQGALNRQVLTQQGLITEAGFEEQAQSYNIMSSTARFAAEEENKNASRTALGGYISGGIKALSAVATLF